MEEVKPEGNAAPFVWNVKKKKPMSLKTNALLKRNHPVKMMDGFKNKADDAADLKDLKRTCSCHVNGGLL